MVRAVWRCEVVATTRSRRTAPISRTAVAEWTSNEHQGGPDADEEPRRPVRPAADPVVAGARGARVADPAEADDVPGHDPARRPAAPHRRRRGLAGRQGVRRERT